jgi:CAAX prenyl protease-like protein
MSLLSRPVVARTLPFVVYILFLVAESYAKPHFDGRILYAVQVVVVAALLAYFWRDYDELRGASVRTVRGQHWLLAIACGVVVFVLWINLDFPWATLGDGRGVAPDLSGGTGLLGIAVRVVGVAILVPIMEELFWRSFLMRWIDNPDFMSVRPDAVSWKAIALSSVVFGLEHHLWLAGIVAGILFALLFRRTGSLWAVVLAHAVTNGLLEAWVVRTGNWQFL